MGEMTVGECMFWLAVAWRVVPNMRPAEEMFAAGLSALVLRDVDELRCVAYQSERETRWLAKHGKPHHVREMATAAALCREAEAAIHREREGRTC